MSGRHPLALWLGLSVAIHALIALPRGQHPWAFSMQQENTLAVDFTNEKAKPSSVTDGALASPVDSRPPRHSSAMLPEAPTGPQPRSDVPAPANTQQGRGERDQSELGEARAEVEARLRAHLARHFVYPEVARQRGWEGEVVVRLRLIPPGTVEHVQVARSSGYYVIDQAAVRALERADLSDVTVLPHSFEIQLPIIYRLRGG